jgi:hypothetical protein
MIAVMLALLALAAALLPRPAEASLPPSVRQAGYELREVGRGDLRWLGFGIYEASLWTADGRYDGDQHEDAIALSLWYQRRFTRAQLLKITTGEWSRMRLASPEQRQAWSDALARILRDVDRGDNMTAVVIPGAETLFYDRDRLLGRISDPQFGPAFLGIWLDPRSVVADLRSGLLGPAERTDARPREVRN